MFLFFLLAYAITWAVWVPRALGFAWAEAVGVAWSYGPLLAATATVLLTEGTQSVRAFAKSLERWRFGLRWYAGIILGPAALAVVVAGVSTVFGVPWSEAVPVIFGEPFPIFLLLFVILSLTDGLGEEAGWRGFALPRMLQGRNATLASLLLGVLWAGWHLPLFFTDGSALDGSAIWVVMARLPATAIIFTWVFTHTRGSAIAAIMLHASLNLFAVAPASGAATLVPDIIHLIAHWLIAVTLVVVAGSERLDGWPMARQTIHNADSPPDRANA